MSGFESAGLALALFPLLVNQLDNYVRGIEKIRLLRRYKNTLADIALELGTQHMVFLNTLEQALDGVVDDDTQVRDLINEPGGKPWKEPLLQEKLQIKLGRNYVYFDENMASLHAILVRLARKLDLNDTKGAAQIPTPSNKDLVLFLKVMSKAVYDDLLQKIRDTNEALKTLIEQSAQLEISREKRSPWRKLLPRLREARRNAEGLYRAIVHGSYWSCQCRDSHSAHLHLESNPLADSVKSNKQSSFWITFSNSRTLGSEKWTWTDVEFEPCELEANQVCSVMHVEETTASLKKLQISQSQRVRFNIPRVTDKGRNQTSNLPPIENICSMLSHSEKQPLKQGTLGFIVCEPGSTKRYNLHLIKCHSQAVPLQTLQQALPRSSRRDRLYIAAGLARGVVQYHGNWLKAHWDSSDIHLMANDDDGGYLTSEIVYLSWSLKMQQAEISPGDRDEHPSTGRSPLIRNQILFPLALALTELSIGKSIASLRQPRDEQGNNNDENSIRFNTACRLLQNVYRESGSNYGDAVHSCLFWPGAEPRSGINTLCFEDEKFEGKVFSTGVTPLLRDLAHFDDLGAALAY